MLSHEWLHLLGASYYMGPLHGSKVEIEHLISLRVPACMLRARPCERAGIHTAPPATIGLRL